MRFHIRKRAGWWIVHMPRGGICYCDTWHEAIHTVNQLTQ